jgi:flagellar protein FlbD
MDNRMIFLTRFDGTEFVVNSDLILTVERIPDTVVTLTTGDRLMVRESVEQIVERAAAYRQRVLQGPGVRADSQDISQGLVASAATARGSGPNAGGRGGT